MSETYAKNTETVHCWTSMQKSSSHGKVIVHSFRRFTWKTNLHNLLGVLCVFGNWTAYNVNTIYSFLATTKKVSNTPNFRTIWRRKRPVKHFNPQMLIRICLSPCIFYFLVLSLIGKKMSTPASMTDTNLKNKAFGFNPEFQHTPNKIMSEGFSLTLICQYITVIPWPNCANSSSYN